MNDVAVRYEPDDAQDHLTQRYSRGSERDMWEAGIPLQSTEALKQLCRAELGDRSDEHPKPGSVPIPDLPVPTIADIAAGLSLTGPVRDELDRQELLLIHGARARGLTWQQVAKILGLDSPQAAAQRFDRLGARWPDIGFRRPSRIEEGEFVVPPPGWLRMINPPPYQGWTQRQWDSLTLREKVTAVTEGMSYERWTAQRKVYDV
jgi:hypothetical protein